MMSEGDPTVCNYCYFLQPLINTSPAGKDGNIPESSLLGYLDLLSASLKPGDWIVLIDPTRDGKESSLLQLRNYLANWRSRGILIGIRFGEADHPLNTSEALDQLAIDFVLSQQQGSSICVDDRANSRLPLRNCILLFNDSDALFLLNTDHRLRKLVKDADLKWGLQVLASFCKAKRIFSHTLRVHIIASHAPALKKITQKFTSVCQ